MPQWPFLTAALHTGSSVYNAEFLGRRALGNIRLPLCQARVKVLYISITPIAPRETEACCGLNDSVLPHPNSPLCPLMEQLVFSAPSGYMRCFSMIHSVKFSVGSNISYGPFPHSYPTGIWIMHIFTFWNYPRALRYSVLISFSFHSLCISVWEVSIDMSSSSPIMIFSLAASSLLMNPPKAFYYLFAF